MIDRVVAEKAELAKKVLDANTNGAEMLQENRKLVNDNEYLKKKLDATGL